jgi:hypothetical protein
LLAPRSNLFIALCYVRHQERNPTEHFNKAAVGSGSEALRQVAILLSAGNINFGAEQFMAGCSWRGALVDLLPARSGHSLWPEQTNHY